MSKILEEKEWFFVFELKLMWKMAERFLKLEENTRILLNINVASDLLGRVQNDGKK